MKKFCLVGVDGNAFSVMGYVIRAMNKCRFSKDEISKYKKDSMSGDYDHLLIVSFDMIEKCNRVLGLDEEDL